jgi:IstB-like ATP binding protein
MIAAAQARQALEHLGLVEAATVLESRLEAAAQKQLPYADFLADLLASETSVRRERYLRARTRLAHLPFQRTLDQFDFRFQPSIDPGRDQRLIEVLLGEGDRLGRADIPPQARTHPRFLLSTRMSVRAADSRVGRRCMHPI